VDELNDADFDAYNKWKLARARAKTMEAQLQLDKLSEELTTIVNKRAQINFITALYRLTEKTELSPVLSQLSTPAIQTLLKNNPIVQSILDLMQTPESGCPPLNLQQIAQLRQIVDKITF
jgi:hypothetical protein